MRLAGRPSPATLITPYHLAGNQSPLKTCSALLTRADSFLHGVLCVVQHTKSSGRETIQRLGGENSWTGPAKSPSHCRFRIRVTGCREAFSGTCAPPPRREPGRRSAGRPCQQPCQLNQREKKKGIGTTRTLECIVCVCCAHSCELPFSFLSASPRKESLRVSPGSQALFTGSIGCRRAWHFRPVDVGKRVEMARASQAETYSHLATCLQ